MSRFVLDEHEEIKFFFFCSELEFNFQSLPEFSKSLLEHFCMGLLKTRKKLRRKLKMAIGMPHVTET